MFFFRNNLLPMRFQNGVKSNDAPLAYPPGIDEASLQALPRTKLDLFQSTSGVSSRSLECRVHF
jgi:hypothetical protein